MKKDGLHPDRYFPLDKTARELARSLYAQVKDLPIFSPHGHTDPAWFSENQPFSDPFSVFVAPDHYLLRMLYSQGVSLEDLDWKTFARNFHLFRGTPSALWLKHVFQEVFGLEGELNEKTADHFHHEIDRQLKTPQFRPRALFERFKIEVLSTTDAPTDSLEPHQVIRREWPHRVLPTYRPDSCINPERPDFFTELDRFGKITGENTRTLKGYLQAHRKRRAEFKALGATATDHGHPTPKTLDLSAADLGKLFDRIVAKNFTSADAESFRAAMLVEMARMSLDDGLVMQLHPGSYRNHNPLVFEKYGPDKGADIPIATEYTAHLKPLLDAFGNDSGLTLILFTLDESTYARELAPLAGHYPCLKLGPAWWFHDSPEGMLRFREQVTETAGFYNTVGFVDDTRAFFSIPARHDLARRMDARLLAQWVCEHRLSESEAVELIQDLTIGLVKRAYRL